MIYFFSFTFRFGWFYELGNSTWTFRLGPLLLLGNMRFIRLIKYFKINYLFIKLLLHSVLIVYLPLFSSLYIFVSKSSWKYYDKIFYILKLKPNFMKHTFWFTPELLHSCDRIYLLILEYELRITILNMLFTNMLL